MKKFLVITSFLFLVFCAEKTYACSCLAPDPSQSLQSQVEDAFKNSTAVFSAKVLSVSDNPSVGNKKIKVKLTKSWKGKLSKTFTITTASDSAMCGYNFEAGKTYLIYARGDKSLTTNLCTRTAEIASNKDVEALNKIKKKS